jgi:hypothetical protein
MSEVVRFDWTGTASCISINEWLINHKMDELKIQVSQFYSSTTNEPIYEAVYLENGGNSFANWKQCPYDMKYGPPEDLWDKFSGRVDTLTDMNGEYHFIYHDYGVGWKRWLVFAMTSDQPDEDKAVMLIEFDDPDLAIEFKLMVDAPK